MFPNINKYFCRHIKITQMKKVFLVLCLMGGILSASAQPKWNAQYQAYIDQHKDLAIEEMLRHRIPASITLAQGLLESGAGMSELVKQANNHFGIKCHDWTGDRTYRNDDSENECFRVYKTAKDSYKDHSKFLLRNRYSRLFALSTTDYKGWAQGLKDCGYATNPQYASRLIGIIELYKLYQYDTATGYDKFMAKHSGNYQPGAPSVRLHPIYKFNDNYYLKARQGDTFHSIAKEVELSARALSRANEREVDDVLNAGDIIYLKKKKKRSSVIYKDHPHVVKAGESMYDIAQMYGIRLKWLYKMNSLPADYQIQVGAVLRVY